MNKQLNRMISMIVAGVLLIVGIIANPLPSYAASVPVAGTWEDVGYPGFSPGLAAETSLFVDPITHIPYVAFVDGTINNAVSVWKFEKNVWRNVGSPGFSGKNASYISLIVENSIPYVSYQDGTNSNKVTVKKYVADVDIVTGNDNGTWVDVGNPGFSDHEVMYTSLYVASGNPSVPYVAYIDVSATYEFTVKRYDGFNWQTVDTAGFSTDQVLWPSLFVEGGIPYVAYSDDANNGKATVKKYDGTTWVLVGSAFSPAQALNTSLKIDNGIPYVAYSDSANNFKATVMKYDGTGTTGWVPVGSPDFSNWGVDHLSFYVDNGIPYVAYRDGDLSPAKATVMKYDGTEWVVLGKVGFSANQVKYTSLYVDNGIPYVVYQDFGNGNQATVMKFIKPSPSLTADTTNNDVAHDIEITFTDDPDWRTAITSITLGNGVLLKPTDYTVSAGKITIKAGVIVSDNKIWVNAAGYSDTSVNQYITALPSPPILTADATNNDIKSDIDLAFADDPDWRAAITAVWDGATKLPDSNCTVSSGKITIKAGVLVAGNHTITIQATGYTDAEVFQDITYVTPPILTAEVTNNDIKNDIDLTFTDDPDWRAAITGVWDGATQLAGADYNVSTGTITIREGVLKVGDHTIVVTSTGYNDALVSQYIKGMTPPSLTADTTDNDMANAIDITFADDSAWRAAITGVWDGATELSAADYTINDGTITIKAGVLTEGDHWIYVEAAGYISAEVEQEITGGMTPPSLTADTTDNDTAHDIDITFPDDPAWQAAIMAVKEGANTLAAADYSISAGTITIKAGVLTAGSHTIRVTAVGYKIAAVSQDVTGIVPPSPPSLTADTTNNDTAHAIDITFPDNSAWRAAITAIKDGANMLAATDYTVSAGTITINAGVLAAGNHTITVTAAGYTDAAVSQNVTVVIPPSLPGNGPSDNAVSTPVVAPPNNNVDIYVDGVKQGKSSAVKTDKIGDQSATIITVDGKKMLSLVEKSLMILASMPTDMVIVELDGKLVKAMENKGAIIEIKTGRATYTLPALQVNVDHLSAQLGSPANLQDIKVRITIAKSEQQTNALVQTAARDNGITVMVPPVDFSVTAVLGDKKVNTDAFSSYVERMIAIPQSVDPAQITTGVALSGDGSKLYAVPTKFMLKDGTHYAVINSLTNSTYALISSPKTFADVAGHWSKDAVNEMASRMVIKGVDQTHYNPDALVTRAEFAAIIIRTLGLAEDGNAVFTDVKSDSWYAGAVGKAQEYGILKGYEDGTFRPGKTITREEVLVMMSRAMKLAGITDTLSGDETEAVLSAFADKDSIGQWAKQAVAAAVQHHLVKGTGEGLMPQSDITRAETAAIVQRMLEEAKLIENTHIK